MQKYKTIVADPPWKYGKWGKASSKSLYADRSFNVEMALPYPAMSLSEIAALPIPDLADDDCELYVWTTQKYLEHTFPLIKGWGFKVCETLTWCKAPMGTGQGGLFTPTTEFIVHGRKGKMPMKQRVDTTWWKWDRAWKAHSRKPEAFQTMVSLGLETPQEGLVTATGEQGTLHLDGESQVRLLGQGEPKVLSQEPIPGGELGYSLDEFLGTVREKRRPATCVVEHIKSLPLAFATLESSRRGQAVAVRELTAFLPE